MFFVPEQTAINKNVGEKKKIEQSSDTPSLEQKEATIKISREEALNQSERINFENDNIIGSISLKGASIDDLTFKKYKVNLDSEERITLLGPRNIDQGYLIEQANQLNPKLEPFSVNLKRFLPYLSRETDWNSSTRVLTDQYSPANLMLRK